MYNYDYFIRDFARATMRNALTRSFPLYLSTENTILKAYDGRFKDLFHEMFEAEFKAEYDPAAQLTDEHRPAYRRHGRPGDQGTTASSGRARITTVMSNPTSSPRDSARSA